MSVNLDVQVPVQAAETAAVGFLGNAKNTIVAVAKQVFNYIQNTIIPAIGPFFSKLFTWMHSAGGAGVGFFALTAAALYSGKGNNDLVGTISKIVALVGFAGMVACIVSGIYYGFDASIITIFTGLAN